MRYFLRISYAVFLRIYGWTGRVLCVIGHGEHEATILPPITLLLPDRSSYSDYPLLEVRQ